MVVAVVLGSDGGGAFHATRNVAFGGCKYGGGGGGGGDRR